MVYNISPVNASAIVSKTSTLLGSTKTKLIYSALKTYLDVMVQGLTLVSIYFPKNSIETIRELFIYWVYISNL